MKNSKARSQNNKTQSQMFLALSGTAYGLVAIGLISANSNLAGDDFRLNQGYGSPWVSLGINGLIIVLGLVGVKRLAKAIYFDN